MTDNQHTAPAADLPTPPNPGADHWTLTLKTPMGEQTVTLALTRTGDILSGMMIGKEGENPIKDGKADGRKLRWKADIKKPISLTLKFDVEVDGDVMKGTFKAGMFPAAPVTGVRA